jgi:hypothetical protein
MADVRQPDDVAREAAATGELAGMTKAELLDLASHRGVDIPTGATKDDIIAALGG